MFDLFSVPHLLLVMGVAMLLFGTKKLPEIGAGLGRAIRDFRRAVSEPDTVDISRRDEKPEDAGRNG
ncbi:twin-arginine translocase TatA/TatE family subunit [Desulfovibrio legallii]|jgi:sec-independent protein translocase protein TatA|uniref:Sec-independent protein translocase protein TatA n=1 Tax=Desulfovibrio legallii TaxID=571438 RepID=A0A1G7KY15_9BACT|nr:twin-arginine translocase TatA/TatE family subunit [Desulfovibrio legallii]SDF42093.1 sec-independent protein translocase protein TatA [Desulfovibrio legallii]